MKVKRFLAIILAICLLSTIFPVVDIQAADTTTLLRDYALNKTYLGSNGVTYHGYLYKTYYEDGIGFGLDYHIDSIPMLPISYRIDDYDQDGIYELLIVSFDNEYNAILEMYEVENGKVILRSTTKFSMMSKYDNSEYGKAGISLGLDTGKFNCFTYTYNGKKVIGVEESGAVFIRGDGVQIYFGMVGYDGSSLTVLDDYWCGGSDFDDDALDDVTNGFKNSGIILNASDILSLKRTPSEYIEDKTVFASVNHDTPNLHDLYRGSEYEGRIDDVSNITFLMMNMDGVGEKTEADYFKLNVDTNQFIHDDLPYSIDNSEYKSKLYKSSILTWDGTIQLYKYFNGKTNGVCHGIATTMCYGNQGYLDFNDISPNAQNYWQLGDPRNNTKFKDVIVYYQLLQLSTEGKATKTLDKGGWHTLPLNNRMSSFLGSLVDEAKKSQETKKPFILSFRENGAGHSVVVCGYSWNNNSKSHQIKIYDENSYNGSIGNYTTMTIPEDCLSFDFADTNASNGGYKIQDVWSSLSYYGIDKIYDNKYILKTKNTLKMFSATTQMTIQITAGKKFKLENDKGEWLAYDGQDYTGNMTVYDCYTSGLDDVSVWNITIDSSNKLILKNADDGCELIASVDNKGFAVSSTGADSIQIQSDGVMAKGISYQLDLSVQSDKCDVIQIQTDVTGDATVSEKGNILTISSTDSCKNTKVYTHDNAETEILETGKTDAGDIT